MRVLRKGEGLCSIYKWHGWIPLKPIRLTKYFRSFPMPGRHGALVEWSKSAENVGPWRWLSKVERKRDSSATTPLGEVVWRYQDIFTPPKQVRTWEWVWPIRYHHPERFDFTWQNLRNEL